MQPAYSWRQDGASNKIIFTNLTTGSNAAVDYAWKFGDSTTSNDINPVHVYARPGVYSVCLVVESGNNCRKEICQQVEIKSACNVIARFETKRDSTQWNKIWFTNVSSPVNNIWKTNWAYGDGTSSQDYNSFHVYNTPGVYNACLKVTSLNGCSSEYCTTIIVVKKDSCTVKANFSHYSSSASSLSLKFEALYQSNTAQYSWNFGDSTAGPGRIAFHNYTRAGKYNVCLTVKDGNCAVTYCEEIIIEKSANGNRVSLFPNPAVNTVSIDITLDRPGQLSIRFLDGSGGVRSTFGRSGVSGSNLFSLPVNNLSHGLYLVEIKSDAGTWFSRFIKG
jgi:PKD repeat protein